MARQIGWAFPPTGGGRVDRFNDPGIAHFDGNPLVSLARETIQNSLDARAGSNAVEVSFEIEEIARRDALGRDELAAAVQACREEIGDDDDKARAALDHASQLLLRDSLPYLRGLRLPGIQADFARATGAKWSGRSGKLRHDAVAPAQFCRSGGTGFYPYGGRRAVFRPRILTRPSARRSRRRGGEARTWSRPGRL